MTESKYRTKWPIKANGREIPTGSEVTIPQKDAAQLLASGAVEPVSDSQKDTGGAKDTESGKKTSGSAKK